MIHLDTEGVVLGFRKKKLFKWLNGNKNTQLVLRTQNLFAFDGGELQRTVQDTSINARNSFFC